MNKTKILAVITFIITFLLGGVTGYMIAPVDEVYTKSGTEERAEAEEEEERESQTYRQFRKKMRGDLDLTEEQEEQFFNKIKENRRANREVVQRHRELAKEDINELYEEFIEELDELLDDRQLEKFKENYGRDALRKRRGRN